jgi:hypothetical protein
MSADVIRSARAVFAAVVVASVSCSAVVFASLGGTVSSVETDRARMKSALVGIDQRGPYTIHTIQTPTGTTIREYYGANGTVFGVAWNGQWPPDLRQLFGTYFDQYQGAVQASRRARKSRGRLAINDNGLVVQSAGHSRSFSGIAYVTALMPSGVSPAEVK